MMTIRVSDSRTPRTVALITICLPPRDFGDGSIMEWLQQMLEMFLPYIIDCMPTKEKMIEAAREPTRWQRRRAIDRAMDSARQIGVPFFQRRMFAETAVNALATGVEGVGDEHIGAVYDELKV